MWKLLYLWPFVRTKKSEFLPSPGAEHDRATWPPFLWKYTVYSSWGISYYKAIYKYSEIVWRYLPQDICQRYQHLFSSVGLFDLLMPDSWMCHKSDGLWHQCQECLAIVTSKQYHTWCFDTPCVNVLSLTGFLSENTHCLWPAGP